MCSTSGCERPVHYKTLALCRCCYEKQRDASALLKQSASRLEWARRDRKTTAAAVAARERRNRDAERARRDPVFAEARRELWRQEARARAKARYQEGGESYRREVCAKNRARHTGWSPEAVHVAELTQSGVCAICPRPLAPGRGTCADHYETVAGERCSPKTKGADKHTRALLCVACNSGLGHYESPNGQRAAGLRIAQYEEYISAYGG